MTWDEIRAGYPNQRIFVSAIEESFDGDLVHYRPVAILEPVPADEHEAFCRRQDLEIIHGTVVDADTSWTELVGPPAICLSRFSCDCEDDELALPAMRVVVRHAPRSPRAD